MATADRFCIEGLGKGRGEFHPGLATVDGSGAGVALSDIVQHCKSAGVTKLY